MKKSAQDGLNLVKNSPQEDFRMKTYMAPCEDDYEEEDEDEDEDEED